MIAGSCDFRRRVAQGLLIFRDHLSYPRSHGFVTVAVTSKTPLRKIPRKHACAYCVQADDINALGLFLVTTRKVALLLAANQSQRQTIGVDGARYRLAAENQQGVLEDDSFAGREPMKLPQDRSNVVLALHASDKACGGILNGL